MIIGRWSSLIGAIIRGIFPVVCGECHTGRFGSTFMRAIRCYFSYGGRRGEECGLWRISSIGPETGGGSAPVDSGISCGCETALYAGGSGMCRPVRCAECGGWVVQSCDRSVEPWCPVCDVPEPSEAVVALVQHTPWVPEDWCAVR